MASDTSQPSDNKPLFDLCSEDRRQQNDYGLMIEEAITWRRYFGVGHESDVYDDLSLIRLNEPGSMDLVCRSSRNHPYLWIGLITVVSLWPRRSSELVNT